MGHLRSITGYIWALIALPIILATFMGGNFWVKQLVAVTGIQVTPWYTGGEVIQTVDHGQYRTLLHRPVFDGLIWRRSRGFVQIDWQSAAGSLPDVINETIDYNRDGIADFRIQIDTKTDRTRLIGKESYVLGIGQVYEIENGKAVRVLLKTKQ